MKLNSGRTTFQPKLKDNIQNSEKFGSIIGSKLRYKNQNEEGENNSKLIGESPLRGDTHIKTSASGSPYKSGDNLSYIETSGHKHPNQEELRVQIVALSRKIEALEQLTVHIYNELSTKIDSAIDEHNCKLRQCRMDTEKSFAVMNAKINEVKENDPSKLKYLERSSSYNKNKSNISSISRGIKVYQEDFEYDIKEKIQEVNEFELSDSAKSYEQMQNLKVNECPPIEEESSKQEIQDINSGSEFYYSCIERYFRDYDKSQESEINDDAQRLAETCSRFSRTTLMDEIDYDLDGMKINENSSK